MFLQQRYTAAGDTKNEDVLSRETVKGLVDDLAPPPVRGKRASGIAENWLNTEISATSVVTSYQHENVWLYGKRERGLSDNYLAKAGVRPTGAARECSEAEKEIAAVSPRPYDKATHNGTE